MNARTTRELWDSPPPPPFPFPAVPSLPGIPGLEKALSPTVTLCEDDWSRLRDIIREELKALVAK